MLADNAERFVQRCFTALEQADAPESPGASSGRSAPAMAQHFAGRFAAKEAVLKALGTGLADGIAWTDIEVSRSASGRPLVRLSGRAEKLARALGAREWWLSISHSAGVATASAIAVGEGE